MTKKLLLMSTVLVAVSIAGGAFAWWGRNQSRMTEQEAASLEPSIEQQRAAMSKALHARAEQQLQWLDQGPLSGLADQHKAEIRVAATRLTMIRFETRSLPHSEKSTRFSVQTMRSRKPPRLRGA